MQYVKAATTMVNSQNNVHFYDETTLLLIPAGHDKTYSMIALESGGASPYNSTYEFAFVGVTYDNAKGSYTYYFIASDASKQGIPFTSNEALQGKDATEFVKAGMNGTTTGIGSCYNTLMTKYSGASSARATGTLASLTGCTDQFSGLDSKITQYLMCSHETCDEE
jgi:hypothetical protein